MPLDRPNQLTGFGGRVMKASMWMAERCQGAHVIAQPFTGIGRHASVACHEGGIYYTWDTQELCRLVIEGLYSKPSFEYTIERPMFKRGYLYHSRYIKCPDRIAGLIDYIFEEGSDAEKYVLAMAIPACTSRARLYEWSDGTSVEQLWKRFKRMCDEAAPLANMPGEFIHRTGDLFDFEEDLKRSYDTLIFDPPQIFGGTDRYSGTTFYQHLNTHLKCDVLMVPWSQKTILDKYRQCLEMDVDQILMTYNGEGFPNPRVMRAVLEEYGAIVDEAVWSSGGSYTYVWEVIK